MSVIAADVSVSAIHAQTFTALISGTITTATFTLKRYNSQAFTAGTMYFVIWATDGTQPTGLPLGTGSLALVSLKGPRGVRYD